MSQLDSRKFSLLNRNTIKKLLEIFHNIIMSENNICSKNMCDNDSKNNISPKIWGPKAWEFLHAISFGYSDNPSETEKENMLKFFMSLPYTLPCNICAGHCKKNLETNPPRVDNKDSLSRWLVDFHNNVNDQTNKENGTNKRNYSYDEVKEKYEGSTCSCSN